MLLHQLRTPPSSLVVDGGGTPMLQREQKATSSRRASTPDALGARSAARRQNGALRRIHCRCKPRGARAVDQVVARILQHAQLCARVCRAQHQQLAFGGGGAAAAR
eukprot:4774426-Prymnesium_polylepis.1